MSTQSQFEFHDPVGRFDGETYEPARDRDRLNFQLDRVRKLMADGQWRTLKNIAKNVGGSEASVSARLRDLRKDRFGGMSVTRRYVRQGIFEYQVVQRQEIV